MGVLRAVYHVVQNETMSAVSSLSQHIEAARESNSPLYALPRPILYLLALGCLLMAACVAGLTLGLMTLDTVGLEIMMQSSNEREAEAARVIMPVRKKAHLLLVTLLLGNTIATELLPLVLEVLYPGGVFALVLSVFSIMLFGEIIPQAVCSRHALEIGSRMIGFVKVIRFLLYPIAKPIAMMLDWMLGHELGTIYSREELKGLVEIHARNKYGALTQDESMIIRGTLDFSAKCAEDVLTKAENVFRLDMDTPLNRKTLELILECGHSRVPLYDKSPNNIVCLLLVKQLLLIDPDEARPIRDLISGNISGRSRFSRKRVVAPVIECSANTLISDLLNAFQEGESHMAIVYDDWLKEERGREFLGILSIEDIIEEIIQEEIIDETDVFSDNTFTHPAKRQEASSASSSTKTLTIENSTVVTSSRLPGTQALLVRQIPASATAPLRKGLRARHARSDGFELLAGTQQLLQHSDDALLLSRDPSLSAGQDYGAFPKLPPPATANGRMSTISKLALSLDGLPVPKISIGKEEKKVTLEVPSDAELSPVVERCRSQPPSASLRPLPRDVVEVQRNYSARKGRRRANRSVDMSKSSRSTAELQNPTQD